MPRPGRLAQRAHFRRLCDALSRIMAGESPLLLRQVAEAAIKAGLPVQSQALFAPEAVLAAEARYVVLAIPTLSRWHKDASLWISAKLKRDVKEGSIPWNLACGGQLIK